MPTVYAHLLTTTLLFFSLTTHGATMSESDNNIEAPDFQFTQHCAGRYQLELPTDMEQILGSYGEPNIGVSTYGPNKQKDTKGVFRGDGYVEQWLSDVEKTRTKERAETQYVYKELDSKLKTVVYYADHRNKPGVSKKPNVSHIFETFFFKDFPEAELGIAINGSGAKGVIDRSEANYKAIFRDRLEQMQERADHVRYLPWPHIQPGVCLDKEFTVHLEVPAESEAYGAEFYNGKGSTFGIEVDVYSSKEGLDQELSRNGGLLSFFASTSMKVAGREGKLFTSSGKYSDKVREFRWVSTDTKLNSIQYAHLEISGKIDMEDYPEMAPMNGTDVIVGLLKGFQVRENGMLGVKR
ncbi:hypothetical protein ACTXGQ_04755 [Marinobacter sp. 1Y8]